MLAPIFQGRQSFFFKIHHQTRWERLGMLHGMLLTGRGRSEAKKRRDWEYGDNAGEGGCARNKETHISEIFT